MKQFEVTICDRITWYRILRYQVYINCLFKELHEQIGENDTQLAAIYDAIENLLDDKTEKKNWAERERIGYR